MIINNHMKNLLNQTVVTSIEDLRSLRKLYGFVEVHVRGVTLGVPSNSIAA